MTTNQTIDGVPRKLLTNLLAWLERANERNDDGDIAEYVELRALLDAPADEERGSSHGFEQSPNTCRHDERSGVWWREGSITRTGRECCACGSVEEDPIGPAALVLGGAAENIIDIDAVCWSEILRAASESSWMPLEYTRNDWVDDVCRFLREGPETRPDGGPLSELEAMRDAPIPFPGYPPVPEDRKLPAAQPQGEPVAWTEFDVLDFMSVALRHAEYSGLAPSDILDGLRYMAEKGRPALYAEQPAPVAGVRMCDCNQGRLPCSCRP